MPAKKKAATKHTPKKAPVVKPAAGEAALFDRVAAILEQARGNVVRAVNSNMVLAYWLIGREIVQEIQGGGKRAGYGAQVLERLARRLTERFGPGFSETSLKYFRTFYLAYPIETAILHHRAEAKDHGAEGITGFSDPRSAQSLRVLRASAFRFVPSFGGLGIMALRISQLPRTPLATSGRGTAARALPFSADP